MKYYIGCDLGGTNLRAAIVDVDSGKVLNQLSIATLAREGHGAVMARMAGLFLQVIQETGLQKESIGGIGIGVPGMLDLKKGETLFLPNLSGTWPHVPLVATISNLMGLPTAILNDARSITLGEWRFGAGKGLDTLAVFTLGTGIGGGLVVDGRLHQGSGGTAGELGHMTIDHNGPRCGCGNYGCLEVFASGPAIRVMGIKAVAQGLTTQIAELCENDLNQITPRMIAKAAEAGDQIALGIYNQAGFYLGVAASSICAAIAPQRIILSGGVSRAGRLLLDPITRTMRERTHIMDVDQVEVVQGELGDNAGVIGASVWASLQAAGQPA